jgi:hypothetical protein
MKRAWTIRALAAGSALIGLAAVGGLAAPASAAAQGGQAAGSLTLFGEPPGGATEVIHYTACQRPVLRQLRLNPVSAFDNQPLPGCQVVLISPSGVRKVLCAGKGSVPVEYRLASRVLIQAGASPVCTFGPGLRLTS